MQKSKAKILFQKVLEKVVVMIGYSISFLIEAFLTITLLKKLFNKKLFKYINTFSDMKLEPRYFPIAGKDNWFFEASEFNVLQLTDLHIGAGPFSYKKDKMVINAMATMIKTEKPDLVIVTGDLAYPIPFLSGNNNNLLCLQVLAKLFEVLNIYWTFSLGNHDVEIYAKYSKEDLVLEIGKNKMCLASFPKDSYVITDHLIEIKTEGNITTRCLVILDSQSYIKEDKYGMGMKYDNIKDTQLAWYENKIRNITLNNIKAYKKLKTNAANSNIRDNLQKLNVADTKFVQMIKDYLILFDDKINAASVDEILKARPCSSLFFHIPLREYKDAWLKYLENDKQNTDDVKLEFGVIEEKNRLIYHGEGFDNVYDIAQKVGADSTFCGHDHYNNMSISYIKNEGERAMRLTYGMSLDYFAYPFIAKRGRQRGCVAIKYKNKDMDIKQFNYYQDRYVSKYKKEKVKDMDIIVEKHAFKNIKKYRELYINQAKHNNK